MADTGSQPDSSQHRLSLLDLPPEIRIQIYHAYFCDTLRTHDLPRQLIAPCYKRTPSENNTDRPNPAAAISAHNDMRRLSSNRSITAHRAYIAQQNRERPRLALLLSCRQIYDEAIFVLFNPTTYTAVKPSHQEQPSNRYTNGNSQYSSVCGTALNEHLANAALEEDIPGFTPFFSSASALQYFVHTIAPSSAALIKTIVLESTSLWRFYDFYSQILSQLTSPRRQLNVNPIPEEFEDSHHSKITTSHPDQSNEEAQNNEGILPPLLPSLQCVILGTKPHLAGMLSTALRFDITTALTTNPTFHCHPEANEEIAYPVIMLLTPPTDTTPNVQTHTFSQSSTTSTDQDQPHLSSSSHPKNPVHLLIRYRKKSSTLLPPPSQNTSIDEVIFTRSIFTPLPPQSTTSQLDFTTQWLIYNSKRQAQLKLQRKVWASGSSGIPVLDRFVGLGRQQRDENMVAFDDVLRALQ